MMSSSPTPTHSATGASRRKATAAAAIGTVVEYYDFVVYAYFATVIGTLFFPGASPVAALLLTFGAFATSYVVRPLGAMIFGSIGDRLGRRTVLAWVIILMAAATTLIGLLPTYEQIGVLAPVLLTLARVAQGLSVGGEFGGASTFVAEYAPYRRRGFYMSWLGAAIGVGMLAGACIAAMFSGALSEAALQSWGWRVPFLFGLPLGLVGLYLRVRLQDTPQFTAIAEDDQVVKRPLLTSLRTDYARILLTVAILASMTVTTYLFLIYTPSYLTEILGYDSSIALAANIAAIVAFCVGMPLFGVLTDRIGRRSVLGTTAVLTVIVAYPAYVLMGRQSIGLTIAALVILALITAASMAAALPSLPDLFATATRYTSLGIGWNIAAVVFGGAAPLIATSLIAGTGSAASPAFYAILAAALTLLAALLLRDTNRAGLPDSDERAGRSGSAEENADAVTVGDPSDRLAEETGD